MLMIMIMIMIDIRCRSGKWQQEVVWARNLIKWSNATEPRRIQLRHNKSGQPQDGEKIQDAWLTTEDSLEGCQTSPILTSVIFKKTFSIRFQKAYLKAACVSMYIKFKI